MGDITKSDALGVHMKIRRDRATRTTTLDLEDYIAKFLKTAMTPGGSSYWDCGETRETPCDPRLNYPVPVKAKPNGAYIKKDQGRERIGSKFNYLSRVMTLMYPAVICRPDISYAVGVAARGSANTTEEHINCLHYLCLYINGSRSRKLAYRAKYEDDEISIFTDASWIDDPRDRSTSMGQATFVGRCLIDWRSHTVHRIMTSTNHAEFYSSNEGTKMAVFFMQLRRELGLPPYVRRVVNVIWGQ